MFWLLLLFFFTSTFSLSAADTTYSSNSSLSSDSRLTSSSRAIFDATLTLDGSGFAFTFPHTNDQVLVVNNGFTATLTNILLDRFSPSNVSLGSGSSIIFGNNSYISILRSDTLNYTWKFLGTSTLDGQSKTITLGSSGIIEVQASSTLTLKDLTLYDVNNTNLRCLDNTGNIIFDNVKIINRNRWRFQNGAFSVLNNLSMLGGGIFSYESAYASTINDNSSLLFTDAMTFSYDPAKGSGQAVASQQNLVFTNTSSKLICDGVTLKITNTGMRLTKGTIQFDRKNSIYSDASITDTARSFIFGDQTFANDPQINIGPDAKINLESGVLNYNNQEKYYLRYGDSIILKHKTYGVYWHWDSSFFPGNIHNQYAANIVGSLTATSRSEYFLQPGDSVSRWGNGYLGTYVLTGSIIRFESTTNSNPNALIWYPYAAQVSTPNPPYASAAQGIDGTYYIYGGARIYKMGGFVGDKISRGDEVYIFSYIPGTPSYLGCTNLTATGPYKEIVQYRTPSNTPIQPPNMSTDYIWTVDYINPESYIAANRPNSSAENFSYSWPSAATYQF